MINTTENMNGKYQKGMNEEAVKRLMKRAGCEKYRMVRGVYIMDDVGMEDKRITVGLNGVQFMLTTDTTVDLPEPLYEILKNAQRVRGGVLEEGEPEEGKPEEGDPEEQRKTGKK